MKVGVLGGTFDPVHNGHLIIAGEVRDRLGLTGIVFVPAGLPWMRADSPVTAAGHRREMVSLAIAGNPGFRLFDDFRQKTLLSMQKKNRVGDS